MIRKSVYKRWGRNTLPLLLLLVSSCRQEARTAAAPVGGTTPALTIRQDRQATKIDSLFDDFLIQYTNDVSFQQERTRFPLPYTDKEGRVEAMQATNWQPVRFFTDEGMFSVLLEKPEDTELFARIGLQEGVFEWIYPQQDEVVQYFFRRNRHGAWYLDSLAYTHIANNINAEFWLFYKQFTTDIDFQARHVQPTITLLTNSADDNEDYYTTESFSVNVEQWLAWQVPLPTDTLTNIVYGRQDTDALHHSTHKMLCLKSTDGAVFRALYFQGKQGAWQLYQYEDTLF